LEIEHHGQGRATLRHASWGAETELTPSVLAIDKQGITIIHIAALSSARRQLEFVQAIRAMNFEVSPRISVGTYARLVANEKEAVRQLFELADSFFMNENEAQGLFGTIEQARTRPDAFLYVTLGNQGVLVIEGDHVTHLPARAVIERDPTGAGDTFCGATLAGLAMGMTPIAAATRATALAAATVAAMGPASLLT
jgi:sugar/nucleoside kinase (ribokinase family)